MDIFTAYVDGGCNNHNHNNAYGSYAVYLGDQEVTRRTFKLESKTSNQAEYDSLLELLRFISVTDSYSSKDIKWVIFSDSSLMVNQINKKERCFNKELRKRLKEVKQLINNTLSTEFYWISRKKIVEILGH